MRAVLLGLLFAASPLAAQSTATVNVRMQTSIPDLLTVSKTTTEDYTRADGTHVRRITVYVTANRAWSLRVLKDGSVISTETGGRGNNVPVVVEVPWRAKHEATDAARLAYLLTAA